MAGAPAERLQAVLSFQPGDPAGRRVRLGQARPARWDFPAAEGGEPVGLDELCVPSGVLRAGPGEGPELGSLHQQVIEVLEFQRRERSWGRVWRQVG